MAATGNSRHLAKKERKTARTGGSARGKNARATSESIILFFEKELWGMVGDCLFLALPYSFVS